MLFLNFSTNSGLSIGSESSSSLWKLSTTALSIVAIKYKVASVYENKCLAHCTDSVYKYLNIFQFFYLNIYNANNISIN